jgi:two-component system sensor histidine kinase UhpB
MEAVMTTQILLVEDSPDDAFLIKRTIEKNLGGQFDITHKTSMAEAESHIQQNKGDVGLILLDLGLPDTKNGRDTFARMKKYAREIPIVILTGLEDHTLAVALVREGAEDFVNKNLLHDKPEQLRDVLEFASCRHQLLGDTHKKHEEHMREKDEVISWMSGSYSVK